MSEQKSFWSTAPGTIAAIAAMVTAVAGAIPVINAVRSGNDQPTTEASHPAGASAGPREATRSGGSGRVSGGDAVVMPSPKTLDFGKLTLGTSSATLPVEIVNADGREVTLERLRIVGPDSEAFTIAGTTCDDGLDLQPEASCEVEVLFSPSGGGRRAATLLVEPEDADTLEVPLSGSTGLL